MSEATLEAAKAFVKGYSTASTKRRVALLTQLLAVANGM